MERGHIEAESVIEMSVIYKVHPVGSLVETDYLEEKYAEEVDPARALRIVSDEDLAYEVLRRMRGGVAG